MQLLLSLSHGRSPGRKADVAGVAAVWYKVQRSQEHSCEHLYAANVQSISR